MELTGLVLCAAGSFHESIPPASVRRSVDVPRPADGCSPNLFQKEFQQVDDRNEDPSAAPAVLLVRGKAPYQPRPHRRMYDPTPAFLPPRPVNGLPACGMLSCCQSPSSDSCRPTCPALLSSSCPAYRHGHGVRTSATLPGNSKGVRMSCS